MPMQIPASALMIGNPMSRLESEVARDGDDDEGQFSEGSPKCLWVWIDKRHSGWGWHQSIASRVLMLRDGPSIGCTKKCAKSSASYSAKRWLSCGITTLSSLPCVTIN